MIDVGGVEASVAYTCDPTTCLSGVPFSYRFHCEFGCNAEGGMVQHFEQAVFVHKTLFTHAAVDAHLSAKREPEGVKQAIHAEEGVKQAIHAEQMIKNVVSSLTRTISDTSPWARLPGHLHEVVNTIKTARANETAKHNLVSTLLGAAPSDKVMDVGPARSGSNISVRGVLVFSMSFILGCVERGKICRWWMKQALS
jgi:hypothetical protein